MIGLVTDYDATKYTIIRMDKHEKGFEVTMVDMKNDKFPLVKVKVSVYDSIVGSKKHKKIFTAKLLALDTNVRITQEARIRFEEMSLNMVSTCYSEKET